MRQGDPLSPLLFCPAEDVLLVVVLLRFWFAVVDGGAVLLIHGVLWSVHRRAVAKPDSPANFATVKVNACDPKEQIGRERN